MQNKITPVGYAGFTVTKEARGFKGAEENKTFSVEFIMDKEEGLKFIEELQVEANKLHAKEIEIAKSRGKSVRYAPPIINYKDLDDGRVKMTFKRRELDGPPPIIDLDNKEFKGFIRRENKIQVAYRIRPYVMANVFGVTLQLLAVKVLDNTLTADDVVGIFGGKKAAAERKPEEKIDVNDLF